MSNLTPENLRDSRNQLQHLESKITETHGAELALAARAGLAVVGSLSLAERSHPLTLLFEGGSGKGKSTVVNMLIPDRPETKERLYRLDGFTPKAFVSHAANISEERLAKVDLLPKLKDRVLLVKELAPIFRGREEHLRDVFSILTAVLDGKGYTSATGTHGTRGYEDRNVFNWIGATTPIPPDTDRIMAQLGNRIVRFEIVGGEHDEDDLIEFAENYSATNVEDEYQKFANDFIHQHFTRFPVVASRLQTSRLEGQSWNRL